MTTLFLIQDALNIEWDGYTYIMCFVGVIQLYVYLNHVITMNNHRAIAKHLEEKELKACINYIKSLVWP